MACFPIPGDAVLSSDGRTFVFNTGGERLAQRLRNGIKTIRETYKYDLLQGLPWILLLEKGNEGLLRSAIRDFFLSYPEVHSILSLQFIKDRVTRQMSVSYELRMNNGEVVAETTPITPIA